MKLKNTFLVFCLFLLFPLFIKAQLTVNFKADTVSGCIPLKVIFTDLTTSSSAITKREWIFGNGIVNNSTSDNNQAIALYVDSGKYTVELKITNADKTDSKKVDNFITAYAPPKAGFFDVNPKIGCVPFTVNFKDSSTKGSGILSKYTWFYGDGSSSSEVNPTKTFLEAKTFNISLKVEDANGCISNYAKPGYITTKPAAIADFSAVGPTGSCTPPLNVDFTNNSVGVAPVIYTWNFGNGVNSSAKTPPTQIYNALGNYDVSLEVADANGCKDTLLQKKFISIGAATKAAFSPSKSNACPWEKITLTNNSTGATDYIWDFGDGTSSTVKSPSHTYTVGGTYKVYLTSSINGSCASKDSVEINIETIEAAFTSSPNSACITPIVVNYTDQSINATSWKWSFGNGANSTSQNPSNTINTFGDFTDQLIATSANGCSDTLSIAGNIKVQKMKPFFNADVRKGCIPLTVTFTDQSSANSNIVSWDWDFDDLNFSNDTNPTHIFETTGKFKVKLTITDDLGCTSSIVDTIKTGTKQKPNFIAVPERSCAFAPVVFSDRSEDASLLDEWIWEFGDGASSLEQNPIHQYQDTGGFSITLKAGYNGCFADTTKDTNVVIAGPISSYEMSVSCNNPYMFTFKPEFKNITRFVWDFGDGTPVNTIDTFPQHTFSTLDTADFLVRLKTFNDTTVNYGEDKDTEHVCYYKYENLAKVRDIGASFTAKPVACAFEKVKFDATASKDVNDSYEWDFGDSTSIIKTSEKIVEHAYEKSGIYKIKLIVKDIHNCLDSAFRTIKIYHPTAEYASDKLYGCTPLEINFKNLSIGDTTLKSFTWDFGDGQTSTTKDSKNTYFKRGNKSVSLIVEDVLGCKDTLLKPDFIYPMMPLPEFSSNTKLCENDIIEFDNTSAGDELTYKWDFGDGKTAIDPVPLHEYADTGFFNVKLTATDSVGCDTTITKTKYIHVQGIPVANFFSDKKIGDCFPFAVTFTDSSISPYIIQRIWDFGDNQNSINNEKNPVNNYLSVGEFDVTLEVTTSYGCKSIITKEKYITVNGPTGEFKIENENICLGDSVKFEIINSNNNIGKITWSLDENIVILDKRSVNLLYKTAGVKSLILLIADATNNCAITIRKTIKVNDVKAEFSASQTTACPNTSINFTNNSDDGTYLWDFGDKNTSTDKNPSYEFTNSGLIDSIYPLKLIVTGSFGCKDSAFGSINIFPGANPQYTSTVSEGCGTFKSSFTNLATDQKTYFWDFANGSTSSLQNPSTLYLNQSDTVQIYKVMLATSTIKNCRDTSYQDFKVFPQPKYPITSLPDSGCSPLTVNFTTPTGAVSSLWDFDDGTPSSSELSPVHIFKNATGTNIIKKVRYIGTSQWGCLDTTYSNIKVFYNPIADFSLNSSSACSPYQGIITNTSSGGVFQHWDFGDGKTLDTTGLNLSHEFSNTFDYPVSYNVKLITESSLKCTDTLIKIITVNPPIIADFSCDTIICSGQNVIFLNKSNGNDQLPASNIWNLGSGSDLPTFELSPTKLEASGISDTTYNISLIVTSKFNSSCKDTMVKQIFVKHNPIADFSKIETGDCGNMDVKLNNKSKGASSYFWDYGDTSNSDTLVNIHNHLFINSQNLPVSYNISLTAIYQGCSNSKTQTIKVNPKVIASFNPISNGCNPLKTSLLSTSTPGSSLMWEFEGGTPPNSIEINPQVEFTNTGTTDKNYKIKLTASQFGCQHDTSLTIVVYAQPEASFTASPLIQTFPDTTINISNTSLLVQGWNYDWDFGDNKSFAGQEPMKHSFTTYGNYSVKLIISTATCADTAVQDITIKPHPPIASFDPLPADGCPPLTVSFKSTSEYTDTYLWDFGNGETSSEINPTYTYNDHGLYGITLTASGPGGTNTIEFPNVVAVYERAKAEFSYSKVVGLYIDKSPVTFTNESSASKYYTWSFGDNDTSVVANPIKYYKLKGDYSVLLIADNEHGCMDSIRKDINIYLKGILFPNAFTPDVSGANGGSFDVANVQNDIFFPKFESVNTYHLMIFSRWGELIFETFDTNKGWDGYYRGEICQQDVYVWKVEVSFEEDPDKVFTYKGDVTLLR